MRALLAILWLVAATAAPAQEGTGPGGADVVVTGQGQVTRAPDRADLRLGVIAEAEDPEAAAAALAARIEPVIAALRDAGIAQEDIQTGTLGLAPVYADRPEGPSSRREILGYRAESLLSVGIDEIDGIGRVVGAAIAAGANRLDGIGFSLGDPQQAEDEALRRAVADAARKAALVADAAGRSLGPVLQVVEEGGRGPAPMMMRMEAAASSADIAVAPGEIEVTASVRATFGLGGS